MIFHPVPRPAPFSSYARDHGGRRTELEKLIAEALLRDPVFRPKRRTWSGTAEEDARRARIAAAAIVTFPPR